jgi:IS30 family transposase
MSRPVPHNRIQIKERREDVLALLTKGMKGYEIAKELGVDASTVSRDIQYLISQSHIYLNSLAKEALPFMYQLEMYSKNVGQFILLIVTIKISMLRM